MIIILILIIDSDEIHDTVLSGYESESSPITIDLSFKKRTGRKASESLPPNILYTVPRRLLESVWRRVASRIQCALRDSILVIPFRATMSTTTVHYCPSSRVFLVFFYSYLGNFRYSSLLFFGNLEPEINCIILFTIIHTILL